MKVGNDALCKDHRCVKIEDCAKRSTAMLWQQCLLRRSKRICHCAALATTLLLLAGGDGAFIVEQDTAVGFYIAYLLFSFIAYGVVARLCGLPHIASGVVGSIGSAHPAVGFVIAAGCKGNGQW